LARRAASLFPGHAEREKERWVVGVPEAGHEPFVPRVTLTFPTLASTRKMLVLVGGRRKRESPTSCRLGRSPAAQACLEENSFGWWIVRPRRSATMLPKADKKTLSVILGYERIRRRQKT
jgi:6-phosphogluconolactonase